MKGKIIFALLAAFVIFASATPKRTGFDAGQSTARVSCNVCHFRPVEHRFPDRTALKKRKVPKRYVPPPLTEEETKIANVVKGINSFANANTLARAIVKYAPKAHLAPELFTAILAHESGLRKDVQVCYNWKDRKTGNIIAMCDIGLGQINSYFWAGKFDFERILVDEAYAVSVAAVILDNLYKTYGELDPDGWWTTYNSVGVSARAKYEGLVKTRLNQVLALASSV